MGVALAVSLAYGTFAAGGADSYGYLSQAELFARGRLVESLPAEPGFSWPNRRATLTPLGFTPWRGGEGMAPTYPPGLPLLMAPLTLLHPSAVFLFVPFCAVVAVWVCWQLGRAMGEPLAGGLAAALLAVSPTFTYQAIQPMSDVPVAAFWTGALLLAASTRPRAAAAAGLAAGLAVLIRPNLAPLLVLVAAAAAWARGERRPRRALVTLAAAAPAIVALGAIQYVRFGSPFGSGYGTVEELFSLAYIRPNLERYPRWMIEAHTWFIALWIAAPLAIVRLPVAGRALAWIGYLFAGAVAVAYLPYIYFQPQEWFYTRFLLPAIPLMILLGMLLVLQAMRRAAPRAATPVAVLLTLALAGVYAANAVSRGVPVLRDAERKFPEVGRFVAAHLP
jgi:4-amino-4-deoxy-L-arabinose transferase-like glycosyltransferase